MVKYFTTDVLYDGNGAEPTCNKVPVLAFIDASPRVEPELPLVARLCISQWRISPDESNVAALAGGAISRGARIGPPIMWRRESARTVTRVREMRLWLNPIELMVG